MTTPQARLSALGLALPIIAKPVANYVGWTRVGQMVFTAGQLPFLDGKLLQTGLHGVDVSKEQGQAAARQAGLNILAQLNDACGGDISRVKRIVKLTGFVACQPDFLDHPFVINGASDLMVDVFGEAGRHARSAVGAPSLPLNSCVEIEAIAEIS